jgi:hypothetical protein
MAKMDQANLPKKPISLLLAEGDTDELFYRRIKNDLLTGFRITVENIGGLYNINLKIISRIVDYSRKHKDEQIRVYCCLDRESRYGQVPEYDINKIIKYVKDENIKAILSINSVIATQQIESWFFYNINGIYAFLNVPKSRRKPKSFQPPEKFGYKHLQRLFERYDKTYTKGKKAEYFINQLDINKIASNCKELHEGIELIQSQANDLTNHLFSV